MECLRAQQREFITQNFNEQKLVYNYEIIICFVCVLQGLYITIITRL